MARMRTPADASLPQGDASMHADTPDTMVIPVAVRVLRPLGFVDDYGDTWRWVSGQVVRNPYVLGLLASRGAHVEPLE